MQIYVHRPCWGTPKEIKKILDAGFGKKLMLDWWVGNGKNIYIVCGANPGHGGGHAPQEEFLNRLMGNSLLRSGCMLQAEDGLCELHGVGLKPKEGRTSHHAQTFDSHALHEEIARTWNTPEGKKIVRRFKKEFIGS